MNDFIKPLKFLGQNFLLDLNLTDKIIRTVGDLSNSTVIEIGPGLGTLTKSILKLNPKKLVVVEKDTRLIENLIQLQKLYPDILTVIHQDALEFVEEDYKTNDLKIIANLPYNISTVLLFKWLDKIELFSSLTLMFQKEVAERIIAKPRSKAYGRISIMSQWLCNIKHEFDISPQAFIPPPKVTSSVITLIPKKERFPTDKDMLAKLSKAVFGQRRKTLKSSLKQITQESEFILNQAKIDPIARPEELTIEQFCQLALILSQHLFN
jgi:16S rRNA (adenine1518-N6/adenine1519-N6)-dimethyltransferase